MARGWALVVTLERCFLALPRLAYMLGYGSLAPSLGRGLVFSYGPGFGYQTDEGVGKYGASLQPHPYPGGAGDYSGSDSGRSFEQPNFCIQFWAG